METDATKNNHRGKNKVFACFKPGINVDHERPPLPHDAAAAASPTFSGAEESTTPRKTKLRRNFSAALKAVLFKTSLKKSRSENSKPEGYKLRSNSLFSKSKRLVNSVKKKKKANLPCTPLEPGLIFRTNSDRSSLFSSNLSNRAPSLSSSASSCSSSHSRTGSADKIKRSTSTKDFKQKKATTKDCASSNYNVSIDIFIVWACLFALIWGKVFAIVICTSSWLFFAPAHRRNRHAHRPQPPQRIDSFDASDPEYKKRVIMEGLLERNNR